MKQTFDRSQILSLAWIIRRENPALTWGQSQAQSWKTFRLRAALRTGPARFTFTK